MKAIVQLHCRYCRTNVNQKLLKEIEAIMALAEELDE